MPYAECRAVGVDKSHEDDEGALEREMYEDLGVGPLDKIKHPLCQFVVLVKFRMLKRYSTHYPENN